MRAAGNQREGCKRNHCKWHLRIELSKVCTGLLLLSCFELIIELHTKSWQFIGPLKNSRIQKRFRDAEPEFSLVSEFYACRNPEKI